MAVFKKKSRHLNPAQILVFGFLIVIIIGTLLLLLPFSVKEGNKTSFIEALFTATSATCVTGITLFDTYTHWTVFGQVVILILLEVGGIGLLTLVTFFNIALRKKMGLIQVNNIVSESSLEGLSKSKKIFSRIIAYSLIIEAFGAILLLFYFVPLKGAYGVFMAVFTAVSGFCNAGFHLMSALGETTPWFCDMSASASLLLPVALMIFLGGLGYAVWQNIIDFRKTKKLNMHTKIVLMSSLILIIVGAVIYFIIIKTEDVYNEFSLGKQALAAFFTSISTRTFGISVMGVESVNDFSKLFTILNMFIGGAPASTAGGIKVTTFVIILATVISVIKNRNDTVLFRHTVKKEVVYKSVTVLSLSLVYLFVSFSLIYLTNSNLKAVNVLFETVSAFTTTGFSDGVSGEVNMFSQIILIFTMFVGRIGPVSLILSLTFSGDDKNSGSRVLPESTIMVG